MNKKSRDKDKIRPVLDFSEFPDASYDDWRKEVEKLLKDSSFDQAMVTNTYEGIKLQPIYIREDVQNLHIKDTMPGIAPFIRSHNILGYRQNPWEIAQKIPSAVPSDFNKALAFDLKRGQTAIAFKLDKAGRYGKDPDRSDKWEVGRNGLSIASVSDIDTAFKDIDLARTPIHIKTGASPLPFAALLFAYAKKAGLNDESITGSLKADPIGELTVNGELPVSLNTAFAEIAALTKWIGSNNSTLKTIAVDSSIYHNSGGSAVEEIAFALATGLEYIRALAERHLSIDEIANAITFEFAAGSNFFGEIAKLRAARMLWSRIVSSCGGDNEAQKMIIHSKTSYYNKTSYDPHVNMLRTTTEALAAILGGCDSLHVGFFDEATRRPDEFSRRFARNSQLILREESHLDKIIDPAGGSWYIEDLTDKIARKAWTLFQEIESSGGMLKALQHGIPQKMIEAIAARREKNIAARKDIFIGTTMYVNPDEKAIAAPARDSESIYSQRIVEIESHRRAFDKNTRAATLEELFQAAKESSSALFDAAINAASTGATLGEIATAIRHDQESAIKLYPLKIQRGAEMFEVLRSAVINYGQMKGKLPSVCLACFGSLSEYTPLQDFATGFFQIASFDIVSVTAESVDSIITEVLDSSAQIVTICSSDKDYPEIIPIIAKSLKEKKPDFVLALAGNPKSKIDDYKKAGIDEFIYADTNAYELLVRFCKKIGVIS
jgi:methylmalonyl-CoA mutase